MASSLENVASREATPLSALWNRKLHYYLGLYLLLFIWLFAFSGLLLNHSQWKFAEFWEQRQQSTFEKDITPPPVSGDLAEARDLMRQMGLRGEIEWTATRGDRRFNFRVSRPGHIFECKVDLDRRKATVQQIELNKWGVMRLLHTFSGVRSDDDRNTRDWALTWAWVLAMDALAIGSIVLVLSSLWMWWELRSKRIPGLLALSSGLLLCALFCLGLRWIY